MRSYLVGTSFLTSLYLHTFFVYASSEGSEGDSAFA